MSRPALHLPRRRGLTRAQAGMTLLEVLVAVTLTAIVTGSMALLVGAAVKGKVIIATRSANVDAARETLEWMTERLRNAGFNLVPSEQPEARCRDMVVAQDAALQPTATRLYVTGEILNSDTVAGNEVITIGYFLANDLTTGTPVLMEYRRQCSGSATPAIEPVSEARITVTGLTFTYFSGTGENITALTDPAQIRRIRIIRIIMSVQSSQGASRLQSFALRRDVLLRNPDPQVNRWKNLNESF